MPTPSESAETIIAILTCDRYRSRNGEHPGEEAAALVTAEISAAQRDMASSLALLNEHLSGRVYDNLDDAVRNLLQAYVTMKGNVEDSKHDTAALVRAAEEAEEDKYTTITKMIDAHNREMASHDQQVTEKWRELSDDKRKTVAQLVVDTWIESGKTLHLLTSGEELDEIVIKRLPDDQTVASWKPATGVLLLAPQVGA